MLFKIFFVLTVMMGMISYKVYQEPAIPNSADSLMSRTFLAANKLVDNVLHFMDSIGVVDYTYAKRYVFHVISGVMQKNFESLKKEDTTLSGIPVRIYTPKDNADGGLMPGMVYYHGGGWTIGSLDTHDAVTTFFSFDANMVVVSVDYRLSPEYTQRDGLDDCLTVTKHFLSHASDYGVDSKRIVVAGDSAGGNYAAAVSLLLRDENFLPSPKLQLLIYPVTQALDLDLPSYQQNSGGPFLSKHGMCFFFSHAVARNLNHMPYFDTNTHVPGDVRLAMAKGKLNHDKLPTANKNEPYVRPNYDSGSSDIWDDIKDRVLDPYMYPLMAEDLSGLPEAYVFTCQHDPLRDEGYLYVDRLREAGVVVTHYNSPVGWHAMIRMVFTFSDSMDVMKRMSRFIANKV